MAARLPQVGDRWRFKNDVVEVVEFIPAEGHFGGVPALRYAWLTEIDVDPAIREHSSREEGRLIGLARSAEFVRTATLEVAAPSSTTDVDTYDCPEPGCSFSVSAIGTLDLDEPDYFNEQIEEHKRTHQCLCTYDGEGQSVDAECPKHGEPVGALTAPPGVVLVPPPGMTPEARQLLADEFAALAATGSVAHASSQAGLATLWFSHPAPAIAPPALVQLDRDDAAERLADEVADLLTRFSDNLEMFLPVRRALADFRAVTR